jgi:hypothetical protein
MTTDSGKKRLHTRKTLSHCHFIHTNLTLSALGAIPSLRGDKSAAILDYNTPYMLYTARHSTYPRAKSRKLFNELLSISIRTLRHKISPQYTVILFVLSFYDTVRLKGYIASISDIRPLNMGQYEY